MNQSLLPEKRLINFRLPKDLQQSFDYLCSYQSLTRSSVIINLISEYVNENRHIVRIPPDLFKLKSTSKAQREIPSCFPIQSEKYPENDEDFWEPIETFYR